MGMRFTCTKCKGTGNMGFAFPNRCNACFGKGEIELDDNQTSLYEWCEGYFDQDTDIDWLERQLKKLIEMRQKESIRRKTKKK